MLNTLEKRTLMAATLSVNELRDRFENENLSRSSTMRETNEHESFSDSTQTHTEGHDIRRALALPIRSSRQMSIQSGCVLMMEQENFQRFHRLRRLAIVFCVLSFILDIGLGVTALTNCVRSGSFVGFSYSVDTLMDSVCTCFVMWHLRTQSVLDMHRRDRLACCVIGALFIGSFLAIESRAIQSMILAKKIGPDFIVFCYSLFHIIFFTVLSILKILISKRIKSRALMADALNSIIGLIMSFPLLLWDRVTFFNKFDNLDDLVQVLMAVLLFAAGWQLILESITMINLEYARNLRETKLQRMLKEHHEEIGRNLKGFDYQQPNISIAPIAGTRRYSFISNS